MRMWQNLQTDSVVLLMHGMACMHAALSPFNCLDLMQCMHA